ncbi:MAG: Pyruvate dehydrogenase E1 component [Phycisphaerae bacterium]|nr:Pyruvate dehydrogenase E1 component [Phycisphaerae bacterium]
MRLDPQCLEGPLGRSILDNMSIYHLQDHDPQETREWVDSLDAVIQQAGPERARFLLQQLIQRSHAHGVALPFSANTPYINTIHHSEQPAFPGDIALERKIKSIIRWNAMALVVRANRKSEGIGGHISTYASAATLYEVAFNHFFRAPDGPFAGDQIYFQGHAAPGIYARAYVERRLDPSLMHNYRRELATGGGLSSYPHPWLMPKLWQYPTVSMGLGPLSSIYQARFNRYLLDRGICDTSRSKVWAFMGDGEMDEPEALGSITLASRERLDNLIWVINCNLQRLDGPVRGNGQIIQELEAAFRGAGWNVLKVIWGGNWDPLLDADESGRLVQRMGEVVDGEYQKYKVEGGGFVRQHFFGKYPETTRLVEALTDEDIYALKRGGHDPLKVYAAYHRAFHHQGSPTVILAKTVKGYGLGDAGEGKNITHQQKKLDLDDLRHFRDRFDLPIPDDKIAHAPFYRPRADSDLYEYLYACRHRLGGFVPARVNRSQPLRLPDVTMFNEFMSGSGDREASTTMAFVRMLARLMDDPYMGNLIVPIVPDEARTFGMDALFRKYGIYAHTGQLYEPVDSHLFLYYREAKNGQILEEGITEAGSLASFTAAGSAYAIHGVNTIPFFLFYSMFGFQRIGDSIWAAADARSKGFLCGCTAGRTTLAGEGLQHQDGHSLLHASTVPNCLSYDPAFAYEVVHIVHNGLVRMYDLRQDIFYYLALYNEPYAQLSKPEGCEEGIIRGMYKFRTFEQYREAAGTRPRMHLFGSGPILNEALRAQEILAEQFNVAADVWSITSYTELKRDAMDVERWNRLHPTEPPRVAFLHQQLAGEDWPIVAATDYVRTLPDQISPWLPGRLTTLGTDGFGRSEARAELRDFFEINRYHITYTALHSLLQRGQVDAALLTKVLELGAIHPDKTPPRLS